MPHDLAELHVLRVEKQVLGMSHLDGQVRVLSPHSKPSIDGKCEITAGVAGRSFEQRALYSACAPKRKRRTIRPTGQRFFVGPHDANELSLKTQWEE